MAENPLGLPDFSWVGGGSQPNYGSMQTYGSSIPYRSEYGGFGAFPAQANAAYNAGQQGFQWGFNPESFQMGSQIVGGLTSLAQLYGMFQNLGLQKKAFKFAQEGTKRNFNAQATAYNEAVASKETARRAHASANNMDYGSLYKYGTGQKIDKWG